MEPVTLEIIGYIAGFLTTVCMFPQLIKILLSRSAKDVSLLTFIVLICGELLWIVYGSYADDLRIIIPNVVSCILSIWIFIATMIYNKNV